MINIKVNKKDSFISNIVIKGHSGYGENGTDIVCASVSSIAITTLNASIRIDEKLISYSNEDGFLEITIKKENRIINILMNNMLDLLKELAEDYPKNIKITLN